VSPLPTAWVLGIIFCSASIPVGITGGSAGGDVFRFDDGNRPQPHTSRNMLVSPVDITGSTLEVATGIAFCEHRFVARGVVQVCGRSPNAALQLLKTFRSPRDGKSILERVSSYPSVVFPINHAGGFLDASVVKPTWSGSNWTYYAEFMDGREARKFVAYLENELAPQLVNDVGLSCSAVRRVEGEGPVRRVDDQTYDVRVHGHICGTSAEESATQLVSHILETYPSAAHPRTPVQLMSNLQTQTVSICGPNDECCCRSPIELDFVASFSDPSDAELFDRFLVQQGGNAVRPLAAECDFCATINNIRMCSYSLCREFSPPSAEYSTLRFFQE